MLKANCADVVIEPLSGRSIPEILSLQTEANLGSWSKEDYQKEIFREDSIPLVAFCENDLAGFIVLRLTSGGEAEVYNLAVKDKYRGLGVGKALLTEAIAKALSLQQITDVWLEVRESNLRAIEFYQKKGFKSAGRRKNFYSHPVENALLMNLKIKE